jgi:SAM-dependent methyltransferase
LGSFQLQVGITAFCLSSLPNKLIEPERTVATTGGDFEFEKDGDIENDDYTKASIYSLLYSVYATHMGMVMSDKGVAYQFTFNTWGIAGGPYPPEEPQRHGKNAYHGLVDFPQVHEYLREVTDAPLIVEIGCGTGAGANLITPEILPKATYYAIDMQAAAIDTCLKIHGNATNPNLKCIHESGGVGNNGNFVRDPQGLKVADNSVDFVIISETHIADIEIGPEEKEIFSEIKRILKPGGLFLWGNALPTRVWVAAYPILTDEFGFERVASINHTQNAIIARDEDTPRVNAYVSQLLHRFPVTTWGGSRGKTCGLVLDRLIKNFYRHPGTACYLKMVTGYDSYLHEAYKK